MDRERKYWWVNQGRYLNFEKEGYLWTPLENKSGRKVPHWETMKDLKVGDVILHYNKGFIKFISIVKEEAQITEKPNSTMLDLFQHIGRVAKVDYVELNKPIDKKSFANSLMEMDLHPKVIDSRGNVVQGYLYPLKKEAFDVIVKDTELPISV